MCFPCKSTGPICGRSFYSLMILLSICVGSCLAADPVKTEMSHEEVWTGQAVPMAVTLYAPGPFSGAASFDLPEVSLTAITTTGSPAVGSEKIDGVTFYTQRHTFNVYTQQTGDVTIPAFAVRFEWQDSSGSEATSIIGESSELTFSCSRPPGTEDMGVVIAAEEFRVEQSWTPDEVETVSPGDLFQRRIEINAVGTTAMMLPQVIAPPQDGIRVYANNPEILDRTQRGETSAQRIDTLKYQFERAGTFNLPELEFIWWDVNGKTLRKETVPGRTINVAGVTDSKPTDAPEVVPTQRSYWGSIVGVILIVASWFFRVQILDACRQLFGRRHTPEMLVVDRVNKACRANHPRAAYAALLEWHCLVGRVAGETGCVALDRETRVLAKQLYALPPENSVWIGDALRSAIQQAESELRSPDKRSSMSDLPALNPTRPV